MPFCASVAKVLSISVSLRACNNSSFRSSVRAASCASLVCAFVFGLSGFMRQPITRAVDGLVQRFELFGHDCVGNAGYARNVAARSVKASNEAELDWITDDREED